MGSLSVFFRSSLSLIRSRGGYYFLVFLAFGISFLSCKDDPVKPEEEIPKQWRKVQALGDIDVLDVKILNDELYIAGRDESGRGVIYKSSDAVNWEMINPAVGDTLERGVQSIEFYKGSLVAVYPGRPVYSISKDKITRLTPPLNYDSREMIVDKYNNLLVGCSNPAGILKYITDDGIFDIYDSLYVSLEGECTQMNGRRGVVDVTKFLKDIYTEDILIGNTYTHHFITQFFDRNIQCFPHRGISPWQIQTGCFDLLYKEDTLLAAASSEVKYLDNSEWKTYGVPLPKTPDNGTSVATSIAYNDKDKQLFVSGTYLGVLRWDNSGWVKMNDGLSSKEGFYDFVHDIIYFKDYLILTYGTGKAYQSTSRGVYVYSSK